MSIFDCSTNCVLTNNLKFIQMKTSTHAGPGNKFGALGILLISAVLFTSVFASESGVKQLQLNEIGGGGGINRTP